MVDKGQKPRGDKRGKQKQKHRRRDHKEAHVSLGRYGLVRWVGRHSRGFQDTSFSAFSAPSDAPLSASLANGFQRVNFFGRLVRANSQNAREPAERVAGFMAGRRLHPVKRDFKHNLRLNGSHFAVRVFGDGVGL